MPAVFSATLPVANSAPPSRKMREKVPRRAITNRPLVLLAPINALLEMVIVDPSEASMPELE